MIREEINMEKGAINESLRKFFECRDDLFHEDSDGFALQISRFRN